VAMPTAPTSKPPLVGAGGVTATTPAQGTVAATGAARSASRKFIRASAKSPREQARRVAWGREWGAIVRAETAKIMRGSR